MSREIKQGNMIAHRKVQFSDVKRRVNIVPKKTDDEECKKAESVVDKSMVNMASDEAMQNAVDDVMKFEKKSRKFPQVEFGLKRMALALVVAMALVAGVVYAVDASTPDPSLKVIALQSGIDAVYPEYVPRGYVLSDITSEDSRVIMNFKNMDEKAEYSLVEEVVGANGEEMLNEYVNGVFGSDYTRIDEQDKVVYVGNKGAAWVDGGILFKLEIASGNLTRKQILTIATMK